VVPSKVHWDLRRLDRADQYVRSWLHEKAPEDTLHGHDSEVVLVGVAVAYLVVVRWSWMCVIEVGDLGH
jgi:hypothetical protein